MLSLLLLKAKPLDRLHLAPEAREGGGRRALSWATRTNSSWRVRWG